MAKGISKYDHLSLADKPTGSAIAIVSGSDVSVLNAEPVINGDQLQNARKRSG